MPICGILASSASASAAAPVAPSAAITELAQALLGRIRGEHFAKASNQ